LEAAKAKAAMKQEMMLKAETARKEAADKGEVSI